MLLSSRQKRNANGRHISSEDYARALYNARRDFKKRRKLRHKCASTSNSSETMRSAEYTNCTIKSLQSTSGSSQKCRKCLSDFSSKYSPSPLRKVRLRLNVGEEIDAPSGRYEIVSVIGIGGFSDVYETKKKDTDELYAIKTENGNVDEKYARLQYEAAVMEAYAKLSDQSHREHFINIFDKGSTEFFKFIIMELIGPTIHDLRKVVGTNFSKSTSIRISQQTLQAIWDLHFAGFIHRDIKPHNFAIGRKPKDGVIYIFDFGIARKYTMKQPQRLR